MSKKDIEDKSMKVKVYNKLNSSLGRELPDSVKPRAEAIIIALVVNMPIGTDYKESTYRTNNGSIVRKYENELNLTVAQFAEIYHYGMSYGIVLSVGVGVKTELKRGDKILLRAMPDEVFVYGGKLFYVIKEWDIFAVVDSSNKEIERSNE